MGNLVIPESLLEQVKMSPAELRLEMAVYLWQSKRLQFTQACELAGISADSFREILLTKGTVSLNQELSRDNHFLSEILGSLEDAAGEEIESVTSSEFKAIEGEW